MQVMMKKNRYLDKGVQVLNELTYKVEKEKAINSHINILAEKQKKEKKKQILEDCKKIETKKGLLGRINDFCRRFKK